MFTIVASSTTISWATAMTARIHQRVGEAAGGASTATSGAPSVRVFWAIGTTPGKSFETGKWDTDSS